MVRNNSEDSTVITAEGTNVEMVEDFCKSKNISLAVKIRLYESLVISNLQYDAE